MIINYALIGIIIALSLTACENKSVESVAAADIDNAVDCKFRTAYMSHLTPALDGATVAILARNGRVYLRVSQVAGGTPSARNGFAGDDVITQICGVDYEDVLGTSQVCCRTGSEEKMHITVERDGKHVIVELQEPNL